jgi:excisionase family DNA binding protein
MLLTANELCEQLKIKLSNLYKLTCSKKIPYCKIGRLLRFDSDEIAEWVKEQTVSPI